MKRPFMLGVAVLLPLGVVGIIVGLVVGLIFGNWLILWIGLALAISGPILGFGSMALLTQRVSNATNAYMLDRMAKELAGGNEPLVGVEIPWKVIVRQVFRVTDFDRKGTRIENDKVIEPPLNTPYGYLIVESPMLNQPARLPLLHQGDFWLAASVFDDPTWSTAIADEELLTTYAPKKMHSDGLPTTDRSGNTTHCMHYTIAPKGTLARYYEAGGGHHPALEKLFGDFVYEGEVRVGVNRNPTI